MDKLNQTSLNTPFSPACNDATSMHGFEEPNFFRWTKWSWKKATEYLNKSYVQIEASYYGQQKHYVSDESELYQAR